MALLLSGCSPSLPWVPLGLSWGLSWSVLGLSWACLGRSGACMRPLLALLGLPRACLGSLLGFSWLCLVASMPYFASSKAISFGTQTKAMHFTVCFSYLLAPLASFWPCLGISETSLRPSLAILGETGSSLKLSWTPWGGLFCRLFLQISGFCFGLPRYLAFRSFEIPGF